MELADRAARLAAEGRPRGPGDDAGGRRRAERPYVAMKHAECAEIGVATFDGTCRRARPRPRSRPSSTGSTPTRGSSRSWSSCPCPAGIERGRGPAARRPGQGRRRAAPGEPRSTGHGRAGPAAVHPAGIVELLALLRGARRGTPRRHHRAGRHHRPAAGPAARPQATRLNAAVTVAHTGVEDLGALTRLGDVVVAAAGFAGLVTPDMIKPGAAVVGAGMSRRGRSS